MSSAMLIPLAAAAAMILTPAASRAAATIIMSPQAQPAASFPRVPRCNRLLLDAAAQAPSAAAQRAAKPPLNVPLLSEQISAASDPLPLLSAAGSLSGKNYYRLLKALRKRKAWKACLQVIAYIRSTAPSKLNSRHVTVAIGACGAACETKAVLRLVRLMFEAEAELTNATSLRPDLISLNAAIAACAAARSPDAALALLHEVLPRAGLAPDGYSYSGALDALSRVGDADGAMALLQSMTAGDGGAEAVVPDAFAYAPVMSALVRAGRAADALGLFDSMESSGAEADTVCFGVALHACNQLARETAARGDGTGMGGVEARERALAMFARMEAAGLQPSVVCYNEAIASCRLAAEAILASTGGGASSSKGEAESGSSVAEQLALLHEDALALFRGLREGQLSGASADACSYNAALDLFHGTETGEDIFSDALATKAFGRRLVRKDGQRSWTLDLHGLSTGAAQQAVLWWLAEVQGPLLEMLHGRVHPREAEVRPAAAAEPRKHVHWLKQERLSHEQRERQRVHEQQTHLQWMKHDRAVEEAVGAVEASVEEASDSLQLQIIVGKGRHREAWRQAGEAHDRAVGEVSGSVYAAVRALLAEADVPVIVSDENEGAFAICPSWLQEGDEEEQTLQQSRTS